MAVLAALVGVSLIGCGGRQGGARSQAGLEEEAWGPGDAEARCREQAAGQGGAERARSGLSTDAPSDVRRVPMEATQRSSGIASLILRASEERIHPGPEDLVVLDYVGWTTDGRRFDTTLSCPESTAFPVADMVPGLREALTLMAPGEQRRVWVPEALAYRGEEGRPGGMLVFDVELISIEGPAPNNAAFAGALEAGVERPIRTDPPADVAAPPANAVRTSSGLASLVLRRGTGVGHPSATSRVTVHYSGWTTDGRLFDSSVERNEPATFPLNGVVAGWTEGVQLMVVGEQRRFWIPEELAYQGREGAPAGMLVFDIELIAIE